jgi:hypothetical protein
MFRTRQEITWPFNAPIFLLTNVAVGGTLVFMLAVKWSAAPSYL